MAKSGLDARILCLTLALTPRIGSRTITRILSRNDLLGVTPDTFWSLSMQTLVEEYRLTQSQADEWVGRRASLRDEAKRLCEKLDQFGVQMFTPADALYPALLEEMNPDPPGVLFTYGNEKLLESQTFTVMSSRNSAPAALDLMEKCAEEGVLAGEILVAGFGTPEYERAAVVPLRWGSPRILCADRGLFVALGESLKEEPFRAARLWRYQFDATTDLAVSSINPEKGYHIDANRKRDHLVAGLSKRLDFVAVNPGGNMEKIARNALKAGRAVRISDHFLGAREWTRYGAKMIEL